jgi:acyl-coenzyme A synthetase/AMP-(fatty) acid ligase
VYVGDCEPKEIQQFLLGLDPHLRSTLLAKVDNIPKGHLGKISRSFLKQNIQNLVEKI